MAHDDIKKTIESTSRHETLPVSDFERQGPLDYPGKRPDTHYITDGEQVTLLNNDPALAIQEIEEYLRQHNLPGLDERIPVLAYGANASPGSLEDKFSRYDLSETGMPEQEIQTTPCIFAELTDHDVVWHGRPGQVGGYFAELYKGDEVRGTKVQVAIQFLTKEQMAIMHTTEGATYEFASIGAMDFGKHRFNQVVSYIAREASVLLDEQGKPISVDGIKREGSTLATYGVRQALEYTLQDENVKSALGQQLTADEYIAEGKGMKLAAKKNRQQEVQEALRLSGKTRDFQYKTASDDIFTTGGFSNLPKFNTDGQPQRNGNGLPVIGYVEFASLDRIRLSPAVRRAKKIELTKQYRAEYPDKTEDEIGEMVAKKIDPILFGLGSLALEAALYYKPDLDNYVN
ncbi:hypothetical protein FWC31_02185 [Candidatus Saccharibacteria bacterium]|nr:hypothetical protein [Candidatus Saccharibacteria bacterium]